MYVSRPTRSDAGTGPPTGKCGGGALTRPNGPGILGIYMGCIDRQHVLHPRGYGSIGPVSILTRLFSKPDPEQRRRLERAVADVARALAAHLELTSRSVR